MGKKRVIVQNEEEALKEKETLESAMKQTEAKEIAKKGVYSSAKIYISSSYNNIIITVTDNEGNVLAWSSAGHLQFKGPKKATSFAAAKVAESIAQKIKKLHIPEFEVYLKGLGAGREAALRSFIAQEFNIISIKDITPVPHGGCRPPKVRRV
ncbi:MAG TPA: 30S ribosomal protein S11 [Candidatus Paceibacterota bacterium]|nr:30S ribosomal protein S11 [Candidatus Paceibacterota bacterium]HOL53876.1 30S ribosomal protein S11 [Candidatus Paceibacterota bacterium]HON21849.1 30S ribosomal protein S11 [Candidatus Paceibacterota bacterium]HOV88536.1 30S ribosomal protein S11 [Candidatus Paceibacterota bacterium]HPP16785.1 30S ribosomal protein S11 [Candidatus Paceibacterota bacterium]